jgi:hypothetical protein
MHLREIAFILFRSESFVNGSLNLETRFFEQQTRNPVFLKKQTRNPVFTEIPGFFGRWGGAIAYISTC